MKGTPGFIGARLKEAREARGLSATALADLLGVSRQAVSQYENDQQTPRPEIMRSIESILKLPPAFFWRSPEDHPPRAIFYRSMSAATKEARVRAEKRYEWLREIVAYIRTFIELPRVTFPAFHFGGNSQAISMDAIEHLASEARIFWGLGDGPINSVVSLLENNGAVVTRCEIGADTLDSFSEYCKLDGIPYIFLGSDKKSAVRSRYDAAHELGHLLLHGDVNKAALTRKAEFRLLEDQAHRFAGAFLLPGHSFAEDLLAPTLDALLALKSKWRVAVQMMIHRGQDLQLISEDTARRLYINLNRRKWRTKEPMDDVLPCESPRLLQKAFELVVDEGIQTRPEILTALPFAPRDIEDLAGLRPWYLEDAPPVLNQIGLFRNESERSTQSDGSPGDLLTFRVKEKRNVGRLDVCRTLCVK